MATRCSITIRTKLGTYKIYRHHDGYPEGVLADIKMMLENDHGIGDPEYFLANLIFLAKLHELFFEMITRDEKPVFYKGGYGVCSLDCWHGDLEYKYTLYEDGEEWHIRIEKYDFIHKAWKEIFRGKLWEAIWLYVKPEFKDGCHIQKFLFELLDDIHLYLREKYGKKEKAKARQ